MRRIISSCLSVFLLTGCATIISGPNQKVLIDSVQPGASASVDGAKAPIPKSFTFSRKDNHLVQITKGGYPDYALSLNRKFNWLPVIVGNVVWGIIPGMLVDFVSGSAWALKPEFVRVDLEKKMELPISARERSTQFFPGDLDMTKVKSALQKGRAVDSFIIKKIGSSTAGGIGFDEVEMVRGFNDVLKDPAFVSVLSSGDFKINPLSPEILPVYQRVRAGQGSADEVRTLNMAFLKKLYN